MKINETINNYNSLNVLIENLVYTSSDFKNKYFQMVEENKKLKQQIDDAYAIIAQLEIEVWLKEDKEDDCSSNARLLEVDIHLRQKFKSAEYIMSRLTNLLGFSNFNRHYVKVGDENEKEN